MWASAPPLLFFVRLSGDFDRTLLCVPVTPAYDPENFGFELKGENLSVVPRPAMRFKTDLLRRPWRFAGHVWSVVRVYSAADVVFVRGPTLLLPFVLLIAALYRKSAVTIYYVAGDFVARNRAAGPMRRLAARAYGWFERVAARRFRLAVAGSALQDRLGGEILFANLIPDSAIRTAPLAPVRARPHIIALGNLQRVKGFDILLEALAKLKQGQRDQIGAVDIYGDGPERGALAAQAKALALEGIVRFHGAVTDHARLMRAVAAADLLVLPSRSEGIPKVILEAASQGTAVLATKVGGVAGLTRPFDAAELADADDPDSLAYTLGGLLDSHQRIVRLSENGLNLARAYCMERQLDRFRDLMDFRGPDASAPSLIRQAR